MASKTFKIGEYCKGGIIQAISTKEQVTIIGKDWDFSAGSNRGSNQSNAKEWTRCEVKPSSAGGERNLLNFLNDLTTSYYADEVMKFVKKHTNFGYEFGY